MIVFQAQNIAKSFGDHEVLKGISLAVNEKERVGLVGVNGSGKTTLLKCLTDELQADSGEVMLSSAKTMGCLEQMPDIRNDLTAWEVIMDSFTPLIEKRRRMRELEEKMSQGGSDLESIMEAYARVTHEYERDNGYACENYARRILIGLGFHMEEFNRSLKSFSGGQKTRLNLGRLLALSPDLLLLDEPTNHLDMNSVEWLEDFIKSYPGTVLVVSHDRMFLDKISSRIVELRGGQLRSYPGNYSNYLKKRAEEDLALQRAYEKQQEYIHATEEYIRRFKAGIKSKQARGRQSQLDRLERIDRPLEEQRLKDRQLRLSHESGREVLKLNGLRKSFGDNLLFSDLELRLEKGEKLALIGPNGCGKTSLLKIISGELVADKGEIILGSRVEMAYFSQEYENLDPDKTLLDEILYNFNLTVEQARTYLGSLLFNGDDVIKQVKDLSGGEKGRLSFLKLILSGANFLLMDEPTNHLDIDSRRIVEQMLQSYEGTVLMVSHDRYFIDQIADRVIAMENGQLEQYWGNYSYYREKLDEKQARIREQEQLTKKKSNPHNEEREKQKEIQKKKRSLEKQIEKVENEINCMENRKTDLEKLLSDPLIYSDEEKSRAYNDEYKQIKTDITDALLCWESLSEELLNLD